MIKRALLILLCLTLLAAGVGGFLLFSPSGLKLSSTLISRLSGGHIHIGESQGKILGDWQLKKVTIHTGSFDIGIDELSSSWRPKQLMERLLHVADVSLTGVVITLKDNADGAAEQSTQSFIPPDLTLPVAFLVARFRVDKLSVERLGGEELFDLDFFSAVLSGAAGRLDLDDARFSHSSAAAMLSGTAGGHLTLSGAWPLELVSEWRLQKHGCGDIGGTVVISETLNDPQVELRVDSPVAVNAAVSASDLFGDLSYRAVVSTTSAALGEVCDGWPEATVGLELQAQGDLGGLSGTLHSEIEAADFEMLSAGFSFHLDDQMLALENSSLSYGDNHLMFSGGLNFDEELNWNAVVSAESFDLAPFLPLPATKIDTRVHLSGAFPDGNVVYSATVGEIEISVAEYDLLLEGGLAVNGTQQGLEVTSCRFSCGEGAIDLVGSLNWANGLQWATDVRLDAFDPSEIDPLPQGKISGSLTSSGVYRDSEIMVETEIESLTGELSGYELSGGGSLVYQDQVLTISNLDITNGRNRISAAGTVDDRFALEFVVNAEEIERIFPPAAGEIEITGSLQGPRSDASLQIDVAGSRLSYQDYAVESLTAAVDSSLAEQELQGEVRLSGLKAGGLSVESVEFDVDGTREKHRFSGAALLERGRLEASGSGSYRENSWAGQVSGISIEDQQFGRWQQSGSLRLEVAAEYGAADGLCFGSGENRFCADAAWKNSGAWSLALDELAFSMDSLNRWGLFDIPVSGIARASMEVSGAGAVIESGTGRASIDELRLVVGPNDYYDEFVWSGTTVDLELEETNLDGRFSTSFIDGSRLSGSLGVQRAGDLANWSANLPLAGEIDADIVDLGFLNVLTSEFLLPAGRLSGTLAIGGTIGDPSVAGAVDLDEGELRIPMLGVHLRDVAGTIEAGFDTLLLALDGTSGDGTLHSVGAFDFGGDQWSGRFTFSGENVLLLDRRAITLIADPDLDLVLDDSGGKLSGRVFVPQGVIEVEKIDRSASESSDVIFIDTIEKSTPWPFHYDIEVVLGDQVEVTGLGLNGKLGGRLVVASSPYGITVGRGFLDIVDGSFAVYGSPLEINRGRLTFDGGPVENPGLDIKASKMIEETRFGYDGVEAGVNISGSAEDFEMDLYSVPRMEDADILAYILLDKPLSSEGTGGSEGLLNSAAEAIGLGKGSELLSDVSSMLPVDDIRVEGSIESQETTVVVGKKLSDELSVSYDYNLFKNAGSFRVRYEFGKGFSVESRNSVESNAVELLYSLER